MEAASRLTKRIAGLSRRLPYRVTFRSANQTKSSTGGNLPGTVREHDPVKIPCRYRPASAREIQQFGKTTGSGYYVIIVPAYYKSQLVDVNAKCDAVVSDPTGLHSDMTFQVHAPMRFEGVTLHALATIAE